MQGRATVLLVVARDARSLSSTSAPLPRLRLFRSTSLSLETLTPRLRSSAARRSVFVVKPLVPFHPDVTLVLVQRGVRKIICAPSATKGKHLHAAEPPSTSPRRPTAADGESDDSVRPVQHLREDTPPSSPSLGEYGHGNGGVFLVLLELAAHPGEPSRQLRRYAGEPRLRPEQDRHDGGVFNVVSLLEHSAEDAAKRSYVAFLSKAGRYAHHGWQVQDDAFSGPSMFRN